MSKIERTEKEMNGKWTMTENGETIGTMQYKWINDSTFEIFSTVVEKGHEGEGNATEILNEAVRYARDHQKKISATCSFAKDIFEKKSVYDDVYEKN